MPKPAWLTKAESQIGYHEGPNNANKYGKDAGIDNEPWCDLFVRWCCEKPGHPLPSMQPGIDSGAAAVIYSINYAKQHNLWVPSWEAKPGFQICYGWDGPGSSPANMHTGLIVSSGAKGSTGRTVEGNRGDQVERQTFVVGSDVVLGCIDLTRLLLGRPKIHVTAPDKADKPAPQPRHPDHPNNTGPTAKQARRIAKRLKDSKVTGKRRRRAYRRLRDRITRALHRGHK